MSIGQTVNALLDSLLDAVIYTMKTILGRRETITLEEFTCFTKLMTVPSNATVLPWTTSLDDLNDGYITERHFYNE